MTSAEIIQRLGCSISAWSRDNKHNPNLVISALHRWKNRTVGHAGGETREILIQMSLAAKSAISPTLEREVNALLKQRENLAIQENITQTTGQHHAKL